MRGVEARIEQHGNKLYNALDDRERTVFDLSINPYAGRDYAIFDYFKIEPLYQGRGLSLPIVKGVIDMVRNTGPTQIILQTVSDDGRSFWPWLGATPLRYDSLRGRFTNAAGEYPTCEEMEQMWWEVTDIDRPNEAQRGVIKRLASPGCNLHFDLEDPRVRERLDHRFSALAL